MAVCCFCGTATAELSDRELSLVVSASDRLDTERPTAEYWCHAFCLAELIVPSVPFDAEAFFE
jgi:hypothetical protein